MDLSMNMDSQPVILVVDDEEANRDLLEAWLLPRGYEVVHAADGSSALEYVQNRPVDALLLDVMMPGMNGFAVCHKIKNDPKLGFIPVVLVTTLSAVEDRVRANAVYADDFLSKPVHEIELLSRVHNLIRLKQIHDMLLRTNRILFERFNELHSRQEECTAELYRDLKASVFHIQSKLEQLKHEGPGQLTKAQKGLLDGAIETSEQINSTLYPAPTGPTTFKFSTEAFPIECPLNTNSESETRI